MKSIIESLQLNFPIEEDNTTTNIEPVTKKITYDDKLEEMLGRLVEVTYSDYKNDNNSSTRQKINNHINEINKRLREVEQMITHASKLKTESGSDQRVFWKGTVSKFQQIDQRLTRLSTKIREINT
jgi:hypothetical protein